MWGINNSWDVIFQKEFQKEYFTLLDTFLAEEYNIQIIFPKQENIFKAFELCDFEEVKVVILGQDPYHGAGQAHGLSFSVLNGIKTPPSLRNIFKELQMDIGFEIPQNGDLSAWAKQGVLLLNATLTVRENKPGSHQKKGWEIFTDTVIQEISVKKNNVVFILWGNFAQEKALLIDAQKHLILKAAHPSPFSAHRGFLGCKHFSKTNTFLQEKGLKEIDWTLERNLFSKM